MSGPIRRAPPVAALLAVLSLAACDAGDRVVAPGPDAGAAPAGVPGFDIGVHPGDAALRAWRAPASPYRWMGYYLVAPCHRDASYVGRRAAIAALGYGTAVLYVGQQTWEGVPAREPRDGPLLDRAPTAAPPATARTRALWQLARPAAAAAQPTCSRTLLSGERGAAEGADAIARTAAEGFPAGTAVFLDLEPMTVIPEAMRAYYRAWVRALLADGRYRPAIYCHHRNAAAIHADVRALFDEFRAGAPAFWISRPSGFALTRAPTEVGFAFATAWQGVLDAPRTWNGVTLTIDENVATSASPSAVGATVSDGGSGIPGP